MGRTILNPSSKSAETAFHHVVFLCGGVLLEALRISNTGFSAEIVVDDLGLVNTYPGGWERITTLSESISHVTSNW